MCGDAAREESIALLELFLKDVTQMPQGDLELDKAKFCQNLKSKKPSSCSASNPPSVPGFDPSWEPNGCGTGGLANWIADKILSSAYTDSYSGEINAPFAGVSFLAACNAHDRCWGLAADKDQCDLAFRQTMDAACSGLSTTSGINNCLGFSGIYHGAVTSDLGNSNYEDSVSDFNCAAWAADMEENGCQS